MAPSVPSLALSPSWQKDRRSLVRATDAVRLCREGGYEQVPPRQFLSVLLAAGGTCLGDARRFVLEAQLSSRSLADCSDTLLLARLRKLIEAGALVVVREREGGPARETPSVVTQRRTIRALDKAKRSALKFEGRSYRLVADADLRGLPDRDEYTVVARTEAVRVLDGLAKLDSPEQASQLVEARKQLTPDWRPPFAPDGLVLLKRIPVAHAVPKSVASLGPAATAARRDAAEAAPEEKDELVCRPCADQAQKNQATVLVQASLKGIPFLEVCTRAASSVSAKVSVKAGLNLSL